MLSRACRTEHRAVVRTFPAQWVSRQSLEVFRKPPTLAGCQPRSCREALPLLHDEVTPSQPHQVKQTGAKPQTVAGFDL